MYTGSSIPYAPHLFELRVSQPVSDSSSFKVVPNDNRRIYLRITRLSGPLAPIPYWSINQSGGADGRIISNTDHTLELAYVIHNILSCSEVYANGYGAGTIFSVIEVLYNLPDTKEVPDVPIRTKSLADKIKDRFLSSIRIGSGHSSANSA